MPKIALIEMIKKRIDDLLKELSITTNAKQRKKIEDMISHNNKILQSLTVNELVQ